MKNVLIYLGLIVAIVALYGFAFTVAADDDPAGKKIFIDKKCVSCHSVESVGIESSKKSDAVDLSNAGANVDANFMTKYLLKEEKINEKPHKMKFKGTDEELKSVIEWLLTLKSE